MTKITIGRFAIGRNVWDNWRGYIDGRRVIDFGCDNTSAGDIQGEQAAMKWLNEQAAAELQKVTASCPECGSKLEITEATRGEKVLPGYVLAGTPIADLPEKRTLTTIAACTGCEFIIDLERVRA